MLPPTKDRLGGYVSSFLACPCYLQSTPTHPALPDVFSFLAPALCRIVQLQESLYQVQSESCISIEPWCPEGQYVISFRNGLYSDAALVSLARRSRIAERVASAGRNGTSISKVWEESGGTKHFSGSRLFPQKTSSTFPSRYVNLLMRLVLVPPRWRLATFPPLPKVL